jgi:hypothetical protein
MKQGITIIIIVDRIYNIRILMEIERQFQIIYLHDTFFTEKSVFIVMAPTKRSMNEINKRTTIHL